MTDEEVLIVIPLEVPIDGEEADKFLTSHELFELSKSLFLATPIILVGVALCATIILWPLGAIVIAAGARIVVRKVQRICGIEKNPRRKTLALPSDPAL
jgi:hypothetical protein